MNEVNLTLNTFGGKVMHKKCIISQYNQSELCIESVDVAKKLNIDLRNSSIHKVNVETIEISMDNTTSTKYTIEFVDQQFMDHVLSIILSNVSEEYHEDLFIQREYNEKEEMRSKIINGVVKGRNYEYLLRHGDHNLIMGLLGDIRKTNNQEEIENISDHNRFMRFYNEISKEDISHERKEFILSVIHLVIEQDYEKYNNKDVVSNITIHGEIMRYLRYCRKIRKGLPKEIISYFLKHKSNNEFSEILLFISEDNTKELQGFIHEEIDLYFSVFMEVLRSDDYPHIDDIHNLYFATCFIFNMNCPYELLNSFYKNVHKLFIGKNNVIYNLNRKASHFVIGHYRMFDLLLFMERHHDFMFPEFLVSTGLLNYFRKQREDDFFYNQLKFACYHHSSVLREYLRE